MSKAARAQDADFKVYSDSSFVYCMLFVDSIQPVLIVPSRRPNDDVR